MFELVLAVFFMVLGLFVLFLEFVIPSFGLLSIAAFALLAAGVGTIWSAAGTMWGVISMALSLPVFVVAVWLFFKSKASRRLSLQERIEGQSSSIPELTNLVGAEGLADSVLRPSGVALIHQTRYDVKADGEFIAKGEKIVVLKIETNSIIVDRVSAE